MSNCDQFHEVESSDTCFDISKKGVSLNTFYAWNPAVGTICDDLEVGTYVCVGVATT